MSVDIECIVIGAGVVGLAIARQLAQSGREVLILEAADAFGTATSARNSEVIHAGIYYAKGSLKAQLCVRGKQLLYDYCDAHAIEYQRCGKLIVATSDEQLEMLASIKQRGLNNGVLDLQMLSAKAVSELEPSITAFGALLSPSTGILDSHGFMLSLLGSAQTSGAVMALEAPVHAIQEIDGGLQVSVTGDSPMLLNASTVINSCGHGACQLALNIPSMERKLIPQSVLAKGSYFQLSATAPVQRLIYPVPVEGGLGVHITLDLGGQVRFGPDVEWVDEPDYVVEASRADSFYAAIRRYWPGLQDGSLLPDYAGIRPKISFDKQLHPDFLIQGPQQHGISGLVNLFGIESPGLTASLAIAETVEVALRQMHTSSGR